MANGAIKNYAFGQKNNWRRTIANEIELRLGSRFVTDLILYLAGSGDIDRKIFTDKGVPNENLIAIDRSKRNIDSLKRDGGFGIVEEVYNVLQSWPVTKKVGAVLLDFCNGLDDSVMSITNFLDHPSFIEAVWMINIQRGHDARSNRIREILLQWDNQDERFPFGTVIGKKYAVRNLHRGYHFVMLSIVNFLSMCGKGDNPINDEAKLERLANHLWRVMAPKFYSYGSTYWVDEKKIVNVFDSAVFLSPEMLSLTVFDDVKTFEQLPYAKMLERDYKRISQKPIAQRIAAMFAVRTKRIKEMEIV